MIANLPKKEAERLDALRECRILDTEPEDAYDDIVRLAAFVCDTPYAAVALIDAERVWFKSLIGLAVTEMPRETSFCAMTILQTDSLIIPDAFDTPRLQYNPLVTGGPQIRFYAGVPLVTDSGHAIGSLCVADKVPRSLTPEQNDALQALARQVIGLMEITRREAERKNLVAEQERLTSERELSAKIRRAGDDNLRWIVSALESTTDGIVIADAQSYDLPITYANTAFLALTGYDKSEVLGRNCRFLQGKDTDRDAKEQVRRFLKLNLPCRVTLLNYRKDGSTFWNELTIAPIRDDQNKTTHFVGVLHNITALKESEAALKQSQARLVQAQRIAGIGDWEMDMATRRFTWSEEMFRLMEFAPADGEPPYEAVMARYTPEAIAELDILFARALETGEPYQMDMRLLLPSGTPRWWHVVGQPILNDEGKVVRVAGTALDITDRRQQEEALRQSREHSVETERRLRLALTGCWLGWWHLDLLTGQYLEFTDQCKAHFGLSPDTTICYADFQNRVHPDDRPRVDAAAQVALEQHHEYAAEYRVLWSDGSIHWISAHGMPEYDEEGRGIGFIGTTQDATVRRRAEEALRERTEVLESVLSTIPHQVFWKDRNSVYMGCNVPFARAAGLSAPEDMVGKRDDELPWTPEEAESYRAADLRVLRDGKAIVDSEETYYHMGGKVTVGLTSKLPLHDAQGSVIGVLGVSQDITERKVLEAERERLLAETERLLALAEDRADRDPLTRLLNHRAFHSRLAEEAACAEREGATLAVAVLDLDNFKFFNDVYGHAVGDRVLRLVAERLQQTCGPSDTLARFGGDEFALLLPGIGHSQASDVETRLLADLSGLAYRPVDSVTAIPITVSVGASLMLGGQDWHEALKRADDRLLRAKAGGEAETEADQVRAHAAGTVSGFTMLDALVTAVDNKDRYTRKHSEDVMDYSLQIARELGMDEKAQNVVAVAALLHDVGKIGVPDAILRKPGKLTDEEFAAIKQHPQMGAIIVQGVPGLEDTLDAVRHHHERWDGGGYPFGLRGEETPLMARLMAVADAFSAMTTDRPYREGMDKEKALSILTAGAGTQWDPRCVEAFLRSRSCKGER